MFLLLTNSSWRVDPVEKTREACEERFSKEKTVYQASASGKAILIGEHAVVQGARAVALPLSGIRMHLEMKLGDNELSHTFFVRGKKLETFSVNFEELVEKACQLFGKPPVRASFSVHSDILIGSGLGSSAALCVGLLRLLALLFQKNLKPKELAEMANSLEEAFHGRPSGLDTSVIAYEKPIIFEKGKDPILGSFHWKEEIEGQKFFPFVLVDTGERKETFVMVEKTRRVFSSKEGGALLARFKKLSESLIQSLGLGDLREVSFIISEAGKLLKELGVVTQKADEVTKEILGLGALAVKVTGSGGGGCLLALLDPNKREEQYCSLVKHFGENKVFRAYS